jgi:glycosyltransferase involved in cell wall biosynthesis
MSREPAGSVLLVVHALPPEESSGSPLVADGYARALAAAGWTVTVMAMGPGAPSWDALVVTRRGGEPYERVAVHPTTGPGEAWTIDEPGRPAPTTLPAPGRWSADPVDGVRRLLRRLQPDIVHVVDNVHLPLSIPEVASSLGIPVVRTVSCTEDLCALIAPVSPCSGPRGYCPAPLTVDRCAACLQASANPAFAGFSATGEPSADLRRRRRAERLLGAKRARAVRQFTTVFDRVVFASERFRAYFEATLPLEPAKVRVIAMGVDLDLPDTLEHRSGASGLPLRFLFAAMADPAKGVAAAVETFGHPELTARGDWRLVLAGGGDRSAFGSVLQDPRVSDHGPYKPADLSALLAQADVGLAISVFETFHRTTREYLAGGLAVVGSTAFGITDAVVHGRNGLVFDHAVPGSLRRAVVSLLDDPELVGRLRAGARGTAIRSVREEVDELQDLYRDVLAVRRADPLSRPA